MSQNGPYPGQGWSSASGEPYAAPADPWGDAATSHVPEQPGTPYDVYAAGDLPAYPTTSAQPGLPPLGMTPLGVPPANAQPLNTPPPWREPPPEPPRKSRNGPIVALVVVLGLLICGGLGTTAYLVNKSDPATRQGTAQASPSAAPQEVPAAEAQSSQDARFVSKGQCVRNEGRADDDPELTIVACASGTYEVLKRIDGRTSGEDDAEEKCGSVPKYTKWYFYDSDLDSLDFVLCLREYQSS